MSSKKPELKKVNEIQIYKQLKTKIVKYVYTRNTLTHATHTHRETRTQTPLPTALPHKKSDPPLTIHTNTFDIRALLLLLFFFVAR